MVAQTISAAFIELLNWTTSQRAYFTYKHDSYVMATYFELSIHMQYSEIMCLKKKILFPPYMWTTGPILTRAKWLNNLYCVQIVYRMPIQRVDWSNHRWHSQWLIMQTRVERWRIVNFQRQASCLLSWHPIRLKYFLKDSFLRVRVSKPVLLTIPIR